MLKKNNQIQKIFFILFIFLCSSFCYALPFTVIPKLGTQLPTTFPQGSTATAYYTVINNTQLNARSFVKYLPPNVTQVINNGTYPDTCPATFNLSPRGQVGDSCTLQLTISGVVYANDADPHHHLFVCFLDGTTCAGTYYPLNVTQGPPILLSLVVTPPLANINIFSKQQFNAIGQYSNGTTAVLTSTVLWTSSNTAVATILPNGLASGVGRGVTAIKASFGSISNSATLSVANPLVSIAITPLNASIDIGKKQQYLAIGRYLDNSTADITSAVVWNSSNTSVASISATGLATGISTGSTFITAIMNSISSNLAALRIKSFVYVVENGSNDVAFCTINSDGSLASCNIAGNTFNFPFGIAINLADTFAYIANNATDSISFCPINIDGSFGTCFITGSTFSGPFKIAIHPIKNFIYVTNFNNDTVTVCAINTDGSLRACRTTGSAFSGPTGITINAIGTLAYITNISSSSISICTIDNTTGDLTSCNSTSGFNAPIAIAINPTRTFAYINNAGDGTISFCVVNNNGSFGTCQITASGFFAPVDLALNPTATIAYITDNINNTVSFCPIKNDGSFATCTITGGFNVPFGIAVS